VIEFEAWDDPSVPEYPIETAIAELNAILVVFEKGVHGKPPVW
jgi:hypothetical protein